MSLERRIGDLEQRQARLAGVQTVTFTVLPSVVDGMVCLADGTRQPLEDYEREHPGWRDNSFTFDFARANLDVLPVEDDEE